MWLDTAVHLWFDRIIRYRTRTGPVRDLQGCCTALLRTRKGFYASRIFANRCCICPYGALMSPSRSPHGLFTGCLRSLNPHGARELIMHALKLYGPRTERRNRTMPHGARAGPVSGRRFLFKTAAREKPVRSPECDATEALDVAENHTGRRYLYILSDTMDMLWEKFQWILPLYMKPISFHTKASVVCSVTAAIFIDFCLKKLNVLSQTIGKKQMNILILQNKSPGIEMLIDFLC